MYVGRSKARVNEFEEGNSPPDAGGVEATSTRSREASFDGADGVVWRGNPSKYASRNISSIPTTPSAPLRWLRIFFLMAQPPLLYQEGSCPPHVHFAGLTTTHTFIHRASGTFAITWTTSYTRRAIFLVATSTIGTTWS